MPVTLENVRELPQLCTTVVPDEWLDEYGHMNVRYYAEMWGRGATQYMRELELDFQESSERGVGFWLLRQVLDYMAEVKAGETVSVHGRILDHTDKMMHLKYWMVNETVGKIAASSEVLVGRADLDERRLASFPEADATRLDQTLAKLSALAWDPKPSGAIALRK